MADENIITKQETTEVIGLNGETLTPATNALASVFDKIQEGKEEGLTNEQILGDFKINPEPLPGKKEAEKKPEPTQEQEKPKPEEKSDLDKKLTEAQTAKDEKKEEDLREKLLKATEVKPKEEAKAEEKKDDIPEEELQVLATDKPKTAKRINALLGKIKQVESREVETKKQIEAKEKRLAELEQELAKVKSVNPEVDEKVKAKLDELAMYRRRYELDNDPEIKEKFDARITASEGTIKDTLVRRGASDALVKLIEGEGGWMKFANSSNLITIPDGEGGTRRVASSELAETILAALPLGERKVIEASMMEQVQSENAKKLFYQEQQAKANEYFKKREEEAQKSTLEQQKQIEEAKKAVDAWQKTVETSEWLQDKKVPETASKAEKDAAAEYNQYNSQLRSLLKKAVNTTDLDGMLGIIQDHVRYYDERRRSAALARENEQLKAELANRQKDLDRVRGASRSVPKAGSISSNAAPPTAAERRPQSLEDAFERLERGESLKDTD